MLNRILFFCLLLTGPLGAQPFVPRGQPLSPVAQLAMELTEGVPGERAKVTAIFYWITDNIDYKVRSPLTSTAAFSRRNPQQDADTGSILPPLDERVAVRVLQTREAVCDGYARLFKSLCQYAGLRAEVVSGYARGDVGRMGRNFRSNHSWNAVLIDSVWHLLDATWAAGVVTFRGDAFIRRYDSRYFLTPPDLFIQDHLPEDPAWALLPQLPVLPEFNWAPFRQSGFVRARITHFAPARGLLEAAVGDTVWVELETDDPEKQLEVWDRPFGDQRLHTGPVWRNYPERVAQIRGRRVRYGYTVASPFIEWLYVVYNGEPVLQYRLKVRQAEAVSVAPAGR